MGSVATDPPSTSQGKRLLRVTTAIAHAVTIDEVFEAVVDQLGVVLGALSAALWTTREGTGTLELARAYGYQDEWRHRYRLLTVDGPSLPPTDALRRGAPLWIATPEQLLREYPHVARTVSPGAACRIACFPITNPRETTGVLVFTFDPEGRWGSEDDRNLLSLVVRYAGQALERLHLLEAERVSRTRAEAAAARTALLYRLARAVIGAAAIDDVFEAALDSIQTALSTERASILVLDSESRTMRFRAWRGLSADYRRAVDGHSPWSPDARDPEPLVVADAAADPALGADAPLFEREGIGALAFVPIVADARLLGNFTVYYRERRALQAHELGMARAIADHVASALSRFAAIAELQQTVRLNEMFTSILGHDLRNPLAAIITSARLAVSRVEGDRLSKPLGRILSSGDRMGRMIDQLLDFSRVRMGSGMPLRREGVALTPLLRQVMDELETANPSWQLRLEERGDTSGSWDGDRLSQVFSNLVANGLQHGTPSDGLTVTVDGTAADSVCVEVRNHGAIPEDLLPSIFEPLAGRARRLAGSRGLGLGLFITNQIVRAHGGGIAVTSVNGDTAFAVTLPRAVAGGQR